MANLLATPLPRLELPPSRSSPLGDELYNTRKSHVEAARRFCLRCVVREIIIQRESRQAFQPSEKPSPAIAAAVPN
jgi:hypothetical protein